MSKIRGQRPPALGTSLFLSLHRAAATPDQTWAQFLRTLQPCRDDQGAWHSEAEGSVSHNRAQQWRALLHGLHQVADAAARQDVHLPEPLTAWAEWIVPVGRLSFPTGRIVNTLDRLTLTDEHLLE